MCVEGAGSPPDVRLPTISSEADKSANSDTGIPKRMTRYVAKFKAHFRSTSKNHYSAHQVAVRLTASLTSFGSRLPSGESATTNSGKSSAGRSWLVLITSRQLGPEELPTIAKGKVGLRNNELLFAFVDTEEIVAHPLRW
jgi:hypothetical protein